MKPAVTIAALVSLLSAVPVQALCTFNLRYEQGVLRWDPIPGALEYRIVESFPRSSARIYATKETSLKVKRRASDKVLALYDITAELDPRVRSLATTASDANDSCSTSIEATVDVDPEFRKLTRKAILPIVASNAGAGGARFRTSLTMRGTTGQRGRIVFHPAGRAASDDDPSLRYAFTTSQPLFYADIVEALGQSGVGSLDIIPDDDALGRVPDVSVYLFNETANGTFGTYAAPVFPFDYLHANGHAFTIPEASFRANVGFRTLTAAKIRVAVFGTDGRLRAFHDLSFPAGWMQLTSASDIARTPLAPGESMALLYVEGSVIGFHTITENATNDPTLVIGAASGASTNVGEYVD